MASNPYGANQNTSDPREQKCWDLYVESIQNGMPNAHKAALEAGYEESSAIKITVRSWFVERSDNLRRKNMYSKAERNLNRILDMKPEDANGDPKPDLLRIVADVSKTVVKSLGKEHYSERIEHTGKNASALIPPQKLTEEDKEILNLISEHARNRARKENTSIGGASNSLGGEIPDQE